MVDVVPSGRNLAKNPSFSLNTSGWNVAPIGGGSGTLSALVQSTDWSWTGTTSGYSDLQGVSDRTGLTVFTDSVQGTYALPATAGTPYSLSIRLNAGLVGYSGGFAYVIVTFKDAANEAIGMTIPGETVAFTNGVPFTLKMEGIVPPVGSVFCVPVFHFVPGVAGTIGTGSYVYLDGFQYNEGETVDAYIDGDQGSLYGWEGTPGASISYRLAAEYQTSTGRGGSIELESRVYLSDRNNNLTEDVTDYILSGQIVGDIDRDGPKWTLSVEVSDPEKIARFSWVAIVQDVDREGEGLVSRQIGLYRLQQPREVLDGESVSVVYSGYDPTILLSDATSNTVKVFAGGTNYITAIRGLCDELGIRHDFVNDTRTVPSTGISFPVGTSYLKMVNELLADIGFYSVSSSPVGMLYSFPIIENLHGVEPLRTYTVGDDSELVDNLTFDPNDDSIFNHVIVYRDDPSKGAILTAVREFKDAESPISIQNLGRKSKVIALQDAADQAALDARAAEEIQKRTMYVTGTLSILPDPSLWLHNVIDLDLQGMADVPGSQKHNGRYYVNSLTFPLDSDGTVKLGIRRVERTDI